MCELRFVIVTLVGRDRDGTSSTLFRERQHDEQLSNEQHRLKNVDYFSVFFVLKFGNRGVFQNSWLGKRLIVQCSLFAKSTVGRWCCCELLTPRLGLVKRRLICCFRFFLLTVRISGGIAVTKRCSDHPLIGGMIEADREGAGKENLRIGQKRIFCRSCEPVHGCKFRNDLSSRAVISC